MRGIRRGGLAAIINDHFQCPPPSFPKRTGIRIFFLLPYLKQAQMSQRAPSATWLVRAHLQNTAFSVRAVKHWNRLHGSEVGLSLDGICVSPNYHTKPFLRLGCYLQAIHELLIDVCVYIAFIGPLVGLKEFYWNIYHQ